MNTQPQMPSLPIKPKIDGQGVVYKKDGTISKPEPVIEQKPKEK